MKLSYFLLLLFFGFGQVLNAQNPVLRYVVDDYGFRVIDNPEPQHEHVSIKHFDLRSGAWVVEVYSDQELPELLTSPVEACIENCVDTANSGNDYGPGDPEYSSIYVTCFFSCVGPIFWSPIHGRIKKGVD